MTTCINKINAFGCMPQGGLYRSAAGIAISYRVYPANNPETTKEIAFTGPDWEHGKSDLNWYVSRTKRHMFCW